MWKRVLQLADRTVHQLPMFIIVSLHRPRLFVDVLQMQHILIEADVVKYGTRQQLSHRTSDHDRAFDSKA